MEGNDESRSMWRFVDGSLSISISMLLAVILSGCAACARLPLLGYLNELTQRNDGIIIVATLLLFPTTAVIYGGFNMFFAAKEAVEKKARQRGRQEGRVEGREEERERINKLLSEHGVELSPELASRLANGAE